MEAALTAAHVGPPVLPVAEERAEEAFIAFQMGSGGLVCAHMTGQAHLRLQTPEIGRKS